MAGNGVRRRGAALLACVGALLAMMLVVAPAASAHAVLESSTPTSGQLLPTSARIGEVEIRFDESVTVSLGGIEVVSASGARVDTAVVRHPHGAGDRVAVALRDHLPLGSYLVLWRVVSVDSHPVHGSFTFSIGRLGPVATAPSSRASGAVGTALGITRFAGYTGLLLLVGTVAFLAVCFPAGWPRRAARRVIVLGLGLTGVATAGGFAVQAAYDVGDGWSGAFDSATLQALAATRLGHAHLIRLLVLGAVALTLLPRMRRPSRIVAVLLAAELITLIFTVAIEGHSGRSVPAVAIDMTHLAAAATWLGGLVALSVLVLPVHRRGGGQAGSGSPSPSLPGNVVTGGVAVLERPRTQAPSWAPIRRFSTVALCCVIVIAATGVLQALRQVPETAALTDTTYGRLLLVKVSIVVLVLIVAALSRATLWSRRNEPEERARRLAFSVTAETVLLVAVLAVTSVLVATTPATASYRPVQERTVTAGPVSVELTAVPSGARTLDVHLYTYGANGLPVDVRGIHAEATPPAHQSGPVDVQLLPAGTGHFIAGRVLLPTAGTWTLTLVVRTSEFDAYTTTTKLQSR